MRSDCALAVLLLVCIWLPSCVGTAVTRDIDALDDAPQVFGWPLFAAVRYDWQVAMGEAGGGCRLGMVFDVFFVCSLPGDLVLDAVLLPLDVVAGCLGYEKRDLLSPP